MGKYDAAPTVAAGLIRLARAKAGLTQKELARRAGVSQQAISAYETGRKEPTLPTLLRLVGGAGYELRFRLEPADHHGQHDRQHPLTGRTIPAGEPGHNPTPGPGRARMSPPRAVT